MIRLLLACSGRRSRCGVAAANNDDGFVWIDANTKIKVKPVSRAGAGGTGAGPQPKEEDGKDRKAEEVS